jgi:putative transposase
MGTVTEMSKTASAVEDEPVLPVQAGPADAEQATTAAAIAGALDPALVARLAAQARAQGVQLLGRGGVLQQLTKRFLEAALEAEMDEHLGYDKHDPAGRDGGNSRNGRRAKTLLTEVGPVEVSVPRDRDGSFAPMIVPKRARRLGGVEDLVISLSAKGLTHGEICAHLAEVYGAEVSKDRITAITDRVMDGLNEWQSRPLDAVYPVIFHRLYPREDPRRAGRQPADLRGPGGHGGRGPGHPRVVGR